MADSDTQFGLADITVPYASAWKPGAVALGVLAAWSLIAVQITSLARRRLSRRVWRTVHMSSYVTFWLTSLRLVNRRSATGAARRFEPGNDKHPSPSLR